MNCSSTAAESSARAIVEVLMKTRRDHRKSRLFVNFSSDLEYLEYLKHALRFRKSQKRVVREKDVLVMMKAL
jgi:hypothetical protein